MGTSTNPVETVAIVDLGNDIQFTYSVSGIVYTLNKLSLRLKQTSKAVYITNADGFNNSPDNQVLPITHDMVSTPTFASNDELFAGLLSMSSGVALGSSGAGGGGNNTWTSGQDFTATPTTGTSNITLTGLSWTPGAENIASVTKYSATGDKETLNTSNVVVSGGVVTLGNEDDFEAGDTVSVTLIGPDKGYDQAGDQFLNFVTNQDSEKWTSPEHLIDLAVDAETNYFVIPMEGYKDLSAHWKFTAGGTVVMTLWGTNNADADDSAVTDWVDISGDYLTKTLSGTTEQIEVLENLFFLKVMVRIVTTGTTNLADMYIKKKAL